MDKAELGLKRVCIGCGERFYDLNKNPATCPNCGKEFDPSASSRLSRSRQSEAATARSKKSRADKSTQSGVSSPNDTELDDDDGEIQDIEGLDINTEDDEVLVEDMEEEDELTGPNDKDHEEIQDFSIKRLWAC